MTRVDLIFPSMGGEARVRLESVLYDEAELEALAGGIHSRIEAVELVLSRFRPDSELSVLNADPRPRVPASPCCAARSPPLAGPPSAAAGSSTRRCSASSSARATSSRSTPPTGPTSTSRSPPLPRAARPRRRPGGSRAGSGSTRRAASCARPACGSTPAASPRAWPPTWRPRRCPPDIRYAISCGGDLAVGGEQPWDVAVRSARSEAEVHHLRVRSGGVATSGIGARIWQREDGRYAHHVIDPATGRPAWTGLVAVTAVAGNALEAEVLAKTALLSGPLEARRLLRKRGGVLQHDDGRVEIVPAPAVVRLPRPVAA